MNEDPVTVVVPPQTLSLKDLKRGMVVVFVDHSLNDHPSCMVDTPYETNAAALSGKQAMVVAVEPNKPGKVVALAFKDKVPFGHTCDGRVPAGHGAYALPAHLYLPTAHEAHWAEHSKVHADQTQIDLLLKDFLG